MPFIFTISNTPRAGDSIVINLTDGDGVQASYGYLVQEGDTLAAIIDFLYNSINFGSLFVAEHQTVYVQPGLQISQVTTNNYGGFRANIDITLGPNSGSPAQTLSFDEETNAFESFLSYDPEMFGTLGTLMIAYKAGQLYTFDSNVYNRFFGQNYESYVTFVFNDKPLIKKTWNSITQVANKVFDCPLIYTDTKSYGEQQQESNLVESDFLMLEDNPSAAFLRDLHSLGGIIDGDFLKGNICVVKLRKSNAQNLVYLSLVSVRYINSPVTGV